MKWTSDLSSWFESYIKRRPITWVFLMTATCISIACMASSFHIFFPYPQLSDIQCEQGEVVEITKKRGRGKNLSALIISSRGEERFGIAGIGREMSGTVGSTIDFCWSKRSVFAGGFSLWRKEILFVVRDRNKLAAYQRSDARLKGNVRVFKKIFTFGGVIFIFCALIWMVTIHGDRLPEVVRD
jgi:hypothetical protein